MSSLEFGTSGLRGLVTDLIGSPSFDYTTAFLKTLGPSMSPGTPVLIGRDLRASSPDIASAVAAAIATAGFRPLDCGPVPTPALALEALRRGWAAIMVTGSHIPDDRNGLKFYTARGEITKVEERAIDETLLQSGTAPAQGQAEPHPDALGRFRARCIAAFPPGALAGLRIGVYQQSSVARDLLVEMIAALGGEPHPFGRASAFIPVDTEAHRPEDLATLRDAAAGGTLDAIVTTDGDGDRPLITDAAGKVIPGDVVGAIAARHLGIGTIAVPVTAGSGLERSGVFAHVIRTRVGSPFVIAGMEQARAEGLVPVAGFEPNGGFLLGSDLQFEERTIAALPTRDSILPILATLAATRTADMTLTDLVAGLGFRLTASHRLSEISASLSGPFLDRLRDAETRMAFLAPLGAVTAFDEIDGIRIQIDGGRVIHFRASGNAPELRCYAEADGDGEADRLVAWGLSAAANAMGADADTGHRASSSPSPSPLGSGNGR
ncbi:MAG: phosphomannomutase [Janthinobacterium lividum]